MLDDRTKQKEHERRSNISLHEISRKDTSRRYPLRGFPFELSANYTKQAGAKEVDGREIKIRRNVGIKLN